MSRTEGGTRPGSGDSVQRGLPVRDEAVAAVEAPDQVGPFLHRGQQAMESWPRCGGVPLGLRAPQ